MRTVHKFTLAASLLALVLSIIGCEEKPTTSNLAGVWELVCDANLSYKEKEGLASNMEFFKDGTGIISIARKWDSDVNVASKWQLREGNRLQIVATLSGAEQTEINEIGLSEKGTVLTFHYDGTNYSGENPRKAVYVKKGTKDDGIVQNFPSTFTDKRDGKKYKTVKIGSQTWMAENLNFEAESSKCYENKPENCAKYGRLYNWETAMKSCPAGWHLPTNAEWNKLYRYVDSYEDGSGSYRCVDNTPYNSETAGKYLKAKYGWGENGNGTDKYSFAALPGGHGNSDGSFSGAGNFGYWWSASENDDGYAYYRNMNYYYETAVWGSNSKVDLFSVRCVQD